MDDIQIKHEWWLGFWIISWREHSYTIVAGPKFAKRIKAAGRLLRFIRKRSEEFKPKEYWVDACELPINKLGEIK